MKEKTSYEKRMRNATKTHIKLRCPLPGLITVLVLMLALPTALQAQFIYTNTNGTITITGYTGPGGDVAVPGRIPNTTNGLLVTSIGAYAFELNQSLTSVAIPNSVVSIGSGAFVGCSNLTSATIPDSVTSIGGSAFLRCTTLTSMTIPDSVTTILDGAFFFCTSLSNVTIGSGVTNIGNSAFVGCTNLTGIYFHGNAPNFGNGPSFANEVFVVQPAPWPQTPGPVYYSLGTTGWTWWAGWLGVPVVLWNPRAQTADASFGLKSNRFGFNIIGTTNLSVVVEASGNLATWSTLQTITLTNGSAYFSDPQWTNYPTRFYKLNMP